MVIAIKSTPSTYLKGWVWAATVEPVAGQAGYRREEEEPLAHTEPAVVGQLVLLQSSSLVNLWPQWLQEKQPRCQVRLPALITCVHDALLYFVFSSLSIHAHHPYSTPSPFPPRGRLGWGGDSSGTGPTSRTAWSQESGVRSQESYLK